MSLPRLNSVAPATPERIRLSVLEPPCRCRKPIVDGNVRGRHAVDLDLRSTACCREIAPVLRGAAALHDDEYLRVRTLKLSLPLLAAIQSGGYRYQILSRDKAQVEMIVWQFMTPEEKDRYLREGVDPGSVV